MNGHISKVKKCVCSCGITGVCAAACARWLVRSASNSVCPGKGTTHTALLNFNFLRAKTQETGFQYFPWGRLSNSLNVSSKRHHWACVAWHKPRERGSWQRTHGPGGEVRKGLRWRRGETRERGQVDFAQVDRIKWRAEEGVEWVLLLKEYLYSVLV